MHVAVILVRQCRPGGTFRYSCRWWVPSLNADTLSDTSTSQPMPCKLKHTAPLHKTSICPSQAVRVFFRTRCKDTPPEPCHHHSRSDHTTMLLHFAFPFSLPPSSSFLLYLEATKAHHSTPQHTTVMALAPIAMGKRWRCWSSNHELAVVENRMQEKGVKELRMLGQQNCSWSVRCSQPCGRLRCATTN